jgi:hypothetical protein
VGFTVKTLTLVRARPQLAGEHIKCGPKKRSVMGTQSLLAGIVGKYRSGRFELVEEAGQIAPVAVEGVMHGPQRLTHVDRIGGVLGPVLNTPPKGDQQAAVRVAGRCCSADRRRHRGIRLGKRRADAMLEKQ